MRVRRYQSEVNVLMDSVIITADTQEEVVDQRDAILLGAAEGSRFMEPFFNPAMKTWFVVGEVFRPIDT